MVEIPTDTFEGGFNAILCHTGNTATLDTALIDSIRLVRTPTFSVRDWTMNGPAMPDTQAIQFEIPMRRPAYSGAISTWLTRYPLHWIPLQPTPETQRTKG